MRNRAPIRLLLRLCWFAPLLLLPLYSSWIVTQPAVRSFVYRQRDGVVRAMAAGKTVWTDSDLRSVKTAWLARALNCGDVLVLGGSRALPISSAWFRPRKLLNSAVLNGGLDEMVSFFEFCVESGKLPSMVLLELNPPLTRPRRLDDPLAPYFIHALARYRILPPRDVLSSLVSYNRVHYDLWPGEIVSWSTARVRETSWRIAPDGSAEFDNAMVTTVAPPGGSLHDLLANLSNEDLRWRTTSQPSDFERLVLERFLDDLGARAIKIAVLMAPINPVAYPFYYSKGGYQDGWLRQELASRGIPVTGNYSPTVSHAVEADFFDDVHPRAGLLRRILEEGGVIAK